MVLEVHSFPWRLKATVTLLAALCVASGCSGDLNPWAEPSAPGASGGSASGGSSSGGWSSGGWSNGSWPSGGATVSASGGALPHLNGEGPAPGGVDDPTVVVNAGQDNPAVTTYVPVCPTDGTAPPLTAVDCPVAPPGVQNCKYEGQECLYSHTDDTCIERWECRFGIWSPRGEECPSSETKLEGEESACPEFEPIHLAPCDVPELECGYNDCGYGANDFAVCSCGRWHVSHPGCHTIP